MKVLDKIRDNKGKVRAAVYARFSSDNLFKLARNQLEVGTLKMTKVLVETFIDKVLVYKDRVEVVFNFCKDISITHEVEDIVDSVKASKVCIKGQKAVDQGVEAILCDGSESSLASTKK